MAALDYNLIGRFSSPNIMQPIQGLGAGIDLRNAIVRNQIGREQLQAQQFANQQAPILAQREAEKYQSDLAMAQAQQKNIEAQAALKAQETKDKETEARKKAYTDSMSIIGRSFYSINNEAQIPIVMNSLKTMADNGVIDQKVFYNIPGIAEGRLPNLQEAKAISNSLLDTKDQLLKESEAAKAKALSEKTVFDQMMAKKKLSLDERNLAETIRKNKANEQIELEKAAKGLNVSLKQIPPSVKSDISENITQSSLIDDAINLLDKNKKAVGVRFSAPLAETYENKFGKNENEKIVRQLIGQIGSLKIKNTSGAAVSASEEPRLQRWIPYIDDTYDVVRNKLLNLKKEINVLNSERLKAYSPDMGYETVPGWKDVYSEDKIPVSSEGIPENIIKGLSPQELEEFNRLGGSK